MWMPKVVCLVGVYDLLVMLLYAMLGTTNNANVISNQCFYQCLLTEVIA